VEQKRAKIAARVPSAMAASGNARSTVTSLADLYARMRRDSGASDRRHAASAFKFTPSPNVAVPPNGRVLHRQSQNNVPPPGAPRGGGRSTASSPDPIAMSEDDQEIMMVKYIPPSSPQVRARLEPVTRIGPPGHPTPLSKAKSRSSTPKNPTATGAEKLLDKPRKSRPNFAIVVPSPPKRPTPTKNDPRSDASQPKEPTRAGTPKRLKEITNDKAPEPLATHTPQPAPVRPTQSAESIPDSIPEYGPRRLRRGAEDLTARDIDSLLGAVPVPFDFSLSRRHHLATRDDGEGDGSDEESTSLWWHHRIFEARAKADIRRTLGALLPADPAQDPPLAGTGEDAGGWKAEVLPRQSGVRMWAERLEDAFGPGPLNRGMGRKPRRVAVSPDLPSSLPLTQTCESTHTKTLTMMFSVLQRPAGAARRGAAEDWRSQNGAARVGALVIVNSHGSARRSIDPPRPPSPQHKSSDDTADAAPPSRPAADVALDSSVEVANSNMNHGEAAAAWTAALLPLVKGKTSLDEAKMAQTSAALGEVERADQQRGGIAREVLKVSSAPCNVASAPATPQGC